MFQLSLILSPLLFTIFMVECVAIEAKKNRTEELFCFALYIKAAMVTDHMSIEKFLTFFFCCRLWPLLLW